MTQKILIVDDEKDIVDLISYNLEKEGFSALKAYDGEMAIKLAREKRPDLMILDLMLPGIQGIDVCKLIRGREETSDLPIIMLTAKGDEFDRVLGLEIGADDYITKPFSVRELVARIRTVLRRTETRKEKERKNPFSYKELNIDYNFHSVTVRGNKIDLSPTEFKLLTFLATHPGRVYTRNQLLDYVWGDAAFVEPRTVDVHIRRLRSQIEEDSANPQYIFTVRGFGYKFADI
ncbi:MAG: response regulator [Thermodesulfobacteriota bacterium]|nr:response regulator [Thermodesulfobacteriota bacterium]